MSLPSYLPESMRGLSELNFNHVEDKQQLLELLDFYRNKVDNQERERVEWLAQIEDLSHSIEHVHANEKQILDFKNQIAELQKATSDAHLAIFDEKNTVNCLRLDYEDLLKSERADMRRIKELQALKNEIVTQAAMIRETQSVHKKSVNSARLNSTTDTRKALESTKHTINPSNSTHRSIQSSNSKSTQSKSLHNKSSSSHRSNASSIVTPTGGVVKTVLLPFDELNNLKAELEYLKQYKIQQKELFEEAIQGYHKDKVVRI